MRTGDPALHYETIERLARPARIAVLTDSADPAWRHTILRIIEFLSSVWGGKHSVIVPTNGSTIEPNFWTILEKFSPDYVYFYRKTGLDSKISDPEGYSKDLQDRIEQFGLESDTLGFEKTHIEKGLQHVWADRFALDPGLCTNIADRLVPFHFERNFESLTSHREPSDQLSGVVDVQPYIDRPSRFQTFELPSGIDPIWWAANTGMFSAAVSAQIKIWAWRRR